MLFAERLNIAKPRGKEATLGTSARAAPRPFAVWRWVSMHWATLRQTPACRAALVLKIRFRARRVWRLPLHS